MTLTERIPQRTSPPPPQPVQPEWVRRAKEKQLPAKVERLVA